MPCAAKMPKCKCGKAQSVLNPGNLCKDCFNKPSLDDWASTFSTEEINNLPDLPDNWNTKSLSDLTAGHLIRLMMGFYIPLQNEIKNLSEQILSLQNENKKNKVNIEKNAESIKEIHTEVTDERKEVKTLKKAVFQQQVFLENTQKKELKNNLIITGVPNDDLVYEDMTYHSSNEKVTVILNVLI